MVPPGRGHATCSGASPSNAIDGRPRFGPAYFRDVVCTHFPHLDILTLEFGKATRHRQKQSPRAVVVSAQATTSDLNVAPTVDQSLRSLEVPSAAIDDNLDPPRALTLFIEA
jgi:hypothetical protein